MPKSSGLVLQDAVAAQEDMSRNSLLRIRRSAAQLHALVQVERTIRTTDTKSRRKYLRNFSDAFLTYRRVLKLSEFESRLTAANLVLVGDYHALPASQRFTAALAERIVALGKPVVLGVEAIVARDQHILDEWQQGEIDGDELKSRIRFKSDWGYDWQPFCEMLERARAANVKVFGLDCAPRQDMRSIRARDRHAAVKIAELRKQHHDCVMVVLFGESHLAPTHLPALLREIRPRDAILTVLQNVDALYWMSAGEPQDMVQAVEVSDDEVCVFTATPLEKYEHYRLCIERWKQERDGTVDLAPSFYNLIATLFRFLNVNPYAVRGRTVHSFLVDQLPEIWSVTGEEQLERLLLRRMSTRVAEVTQQIRKQGSCYIPERNVIVAYEFRMPWAAEQAARFVHHACRGAKSKSTSPEDSFYCSVLERALGLMGSKVLCPGRELYSEVKLESEFHKAPVEVEPTTGMSKGLYRQVFASVVAQKMSDRIAHLNIPERECTAVILGNILGSAVYAAYIRGQVSKRMLRKLFFKDLTQPGAARSTYFETARAVTPPTAQGSLRVVS